jgi:phage gpG-like protein
MRDPPRLLEGSENRIKVGNSEAEALAASHNGRSSESSATTRRASVAQVTSNVEFARYHDFIGLASIQSDGTKPPISERIEVAGKSCSLLKRDAVTCVHNVQFFLFSIVSPYCL